MIKKLGLILFLLFSFLSSAKTILAQPVLNRYDLAYKTYQESLSDYRDTFGDYVLARSQYIRFGTLQAEKEARDKTIVFLEVRDQVVINYLNLLKIKLEESDGIDEARRIDLLAKIDDEIVWHSGHKDTISSALTLQELVQDSDAAADRFDSVSEVAYSTVTELSFGKIEVFFERFDKIFNGTRAKLDSIRQDSREDYQLSERQIQLVNRWIIETEARRSRAEELEIEVREDVEKKGFKGSGLRALKIYNETLGDFSIVVQHLREGGAFIQEIVRIIKTKD